MVEEDKENSRQSSNNILSERPGVIGSFSLWDGASAYVPAIAPEMD
jgi:hypothetical protein